MTFLGTNALEPTLGSLEGIVSFFLHALFVCLCAVAHMHKIQTSFQLNQAGNTHARKSLYHSLCLKINPGVCYTIVELINELEYHQTAPIRYSVDMEKLLVVFPTIKNYSFVTT